jgi:hypothetical protein
VGLMAVVASFRVSLLLLLCFGGGVLIQSHGHRDPDSGHLESSPPSSAWSVQLAPGASAVEHFAAKELQTQLVGLCPPQQSANSVPEVVFHLGYRAAVQALGGVSSSGGKLLDGLSSEGFVLASVHSTAYALAGSDGSARGTLYAVYEWLHQLGVRFYAFDETFFPACPAGLGGAGASLPVLAPKQWRPFLDYRFLTAAADSPTVEQHYMWLLRNRFNVVLDEDWVAPPNGTWWTAEHGLGWRNAIGYPEATSYTIMGPGTRNGSGPPLKLYHEHPSWFWPNNESTSVEGQLCWSEPSLVSFLATRVRTIVRQQPNTTLLSISVLDNKRFCQTPVRGKPNAFCGHSHLLKKISIMPRQACEKRKASS